MISRACSGVGCQRTAASERSAQVSKLLPTLVRPSASKIAVLSLKIATESSEQERKASGGKPLRKSNLADVDGDHQHMNGNRRYEGLGVEAASPPYRAGSRCDMSARA